MASETPQVHSMLICMPSSLYLQISIVVSVGHAPKIVPPSNGIFLPISRLPGPDAAHLHLPLHRLLVTALVTTFFPNMLEFVSHLDVSHFKLIACL